MRIAVCMKLVPAPAAFAFDERTKRVRRDELASIVNPLDLEALGHALALRAATGAEVIAVTMGPPPARELLEDALARGADRALHLLDRRFAGADTLATARALARALDREGVDLVLCGRSTLDGATAQVAPQLAELSGRALVTHVTALELDGATVRAWRETERGRERWTASLPAVVSVSRGPAPPPPGAAGDPARVRELTAEDLDGAPTDFGTRGSPTFVVALRPPAATRRAEQIEEVEPATARLLALLDAAHAAAPGTLGAARAPAGHAIWVLAERDEEGLRPLSFEGLTCAHAVAGRLGAEVTAVLLGAPGEREARELAAHGAERVLGLGHPALAGEPVDAPVAALCAAIAREAPLAAILPWSSWGRDVAPRVAARLGLGLTGDVTGLELHGGEDGEDPDLVWVKPPLAGELDALVIAHTQPSLGTLRPGVFQAVRRDAPADVEVATIALDATSGGLPAAAACERTERGLEGPLLESARVLVGIGGGVGARGAELADELARAAGGAWVASAAAVAEGVAAPEREVARHRRCLAPALYVGLGAHDDDVLDALRSAGTVVLVDPACALPERADLTVRADPSAFARALIDALAGQSNKRSD